jgi:hypothetical protein
MWLERSESLLDEYGKFSNKRCGEYVNTLTDTELLSQWYADRGRKCPRLSLKDEAVIVRALRGRAEEMANPKPLTFCLTCGVMARGEHQVRV